MLTRDFHFELPPELIAQHPVTPRDHSRLMHVQRSNGSISHRIFFELTTLLRAGDTLVLNDTRVMSARLHGNVDGRRALAEVLLLRETTEGVFRCMVRPGKHFKLGSQVAFAGDATLAAEVVGIEEDGTRLLRFNVSGDRFRHIIETIGETPLPPYIGNSTADKNRYQTVYARNGESAAAPTAGLHFTSVLLEQLQEKGIAIEFVTLNVGQGTFLPVKTAHIEDHRMHSESYHIEDAVAGRLNQAKKNGGRIVAVGTTSTRVLESSVGSDGLLHAGHRETAIFIYPGYSWKFVDALITNFHLPESSLIMLVSAFANRALIQQAYATAIAGRYRFYSFGDAMLIE